MRHALAMLLVALVAVFAAYVYGMVREGRQMHAWEHTAGLRMRQLLVAQEKRRLEEDRGRPYAFLSELVAEGRLCGFEPSSASTDRDREVFVADGYLFHVCLLDRFERRYRRPGLPPADDSVGTRFEAWAWPADPDAARLVVFYCNNAGYLVQGENLNQLAGPRGVLPEGTNPIRQLQKDPETFADLWIVRFDVRSRLDPDAEAAPDQKK